MKNFTTLLAGGLVLQLGLAAVMSLSGSNHASFKAKKPLLAFDAAKIDRIDIDEGGKNSVTLARHGKDWVVPAFSDFPADGAKVRGLLAQLASLKRGWPVATSSEAAKRFKVTEETHERRIVLTSGGKETGEVLFGTAPSFRQVHARAGGDGVVYSVNFATYDAGATGGDWMKRDYLDIPPDKIASLSIGDVTIDRKGGKFTLAGLAEGEKPIADEIGKLAVAAQHPIFDGIAGKGAEALAKLNEPDAQLAIKETDGSTIVYKFKKEASRGGWLFGSSAHDFLFRATEASVEPIVNAKREKLVEAPKKPADASQTESKREVQTGASGG